MPFERPCVIESDGALVAALLEKISMVDSVKLWVIVLQPEQPFGTKVIVPIALSGTKVVVPLVTADPSE